jgi:hypothetical protein
MFEIGGPDGDAGLTGRKIIVDTYGGAAPHGGGAFSGKDPTKVDRSAAYVARYLAKNVVAAGLAKRCTIQLSYAIGIAEPLSLYVDLHGTETDGVTAAKLEEVLPTLVRLTPKGIRTHLALKQADLSPTRGYGHFGTQGRGRSLHLGEDRPRRAAEGGAFRLAFLEADLVGLAAPVRVPESWVDRSAWHGLQGPELHLIAPVTAIDDVDPDPPWRSSKRRA